MSLKSLVEHVTDKSKFKSLSDYIKFCERFVEYIETSKQAEIISQNESNYLFFQYKKEGHFNITRPINSNLLIRSPEINLIKSDFVKILKDIRSIKLKDTENRKIINNSIYTIQQSIGATLDALPSGQSNKARKLNGDLFEKLIVFILNQMGLKCSSGGVQLPVKVDGEAQFNMSYQHDIVVKKENEVKLIGSIKTSSKDRIDKIFIDKFLHNKLTEKDTPHIAIFLNDVQRKKTKKENEYGISQTFLPGHFKGYTIKLNPLDGVYYCDLRPIMKSDPLLAKHIFTIDRLLCSDIWKFIE